MSKIIASCFVVLILLPFSAPFSTCDLSIFATEAGTPQAAPASGDAVMLLGGAQVRPSPPDTHAQLRSRAQLAVLPSAASLTIAVQAGTHIGFTVLRHPSSSPVPVPLRI